MISQGGLEGGREGGREQQLHRRTLIILTATKAPFHVARQRLPECPLPTTAIGPREGKGKEEGEGEGEEEEEEERKKRKARECGCGRGGKSVVERPLLPSSLPFPPSLPPSFPSDLQSTQSPQRE